jgi:predicted PurR-regulated permease PerM
MSMTAGPRLPGGERLRRVGVASWSIIGVVILGAIAGWLLMRVRVIFPPLVLAILIIYLLNPIVSALEKRGVKRIIGTFVAFFFVIGGVTVLILAMSPFISRQVEDFSDKWPEFRHEMASYIENTADSIQERTGVEIQTAPITCLLGADETGEEGAPTHQTCDEVTTRFRDQISHSLGKITEIGLGVLEALLVFILAPLLAVYLLIDLPQIQRDVLNLVPPKHQAEVADLANKIGRAVGGFFRGQLLVAFIVGAASAIGFAAIGLPFALVIGAIAGFFNLIPLVGPFIGGFLGFLVGTVTSGVSLGLKAALVELVVQQVDNHIISPNVMRRTVKLHPATVMLAIFAGGALAGFWGVLLGVPAVAVVKLLLGHLWTTRVLGTPATPMGEEAPQSGVPPSVVPPPPEEDQESVPAPARAGPDEEDSQPEE